MGTLLAKVELTFEQPRDPMSISRHASSNDPPEAVLEQVECRHARIKYFPNSGFLCADCGEDVTDLG
jgi:hypothetical protein